MEGERPLSPTASLFTATGVIRGPPSAGGCLRMQFKDAATRWRRRPGRPLTLGLFGLLTGSLGHGLGLPSGTGPGRGWVDVPFPLHPQEAHTTRKSMVHHCRTLSLSGFLSQRGPRRCRASSIPNRSLWDFSLEAGPGWYPLREEGCGKVCPSACLYLLCSEALTSGCCCSAAKSYPTVCDPMDCSAPGLPVLHPLPELAQTHVH